MSATNKGEMGTLGPERGPWGPDGLRVALAYRVKKSTHFAFDGRAKGVLRGQR